jgi:hypothetical protein
MSAVRQDVSTLYSALLPKTEQPRRDFLNIFSDRRFDPHLCSFRETDTLHYACSALGERAMTSDDDEIRHLLDRVRGSKRRLGKKSKIIRCRCSFFHGDSAFALPKLLRLLEEEGFR